METGFTPEPSGLPHPNRAARRHRSHARQTLPLRTSCLNQKGGVGKTAATVGAAGGLAERGRRVLVVDLDPQGHLTRVALRMPAVAPGEPNLALALAKKYDGPVTDLIHEREPCPSGGRIDVIPTSMDMFLVVRELHAMRAPEKRLAGLLDQLPEDSYDHVLIDCPPALDVLTDNALAAADGLLIPVQPDETSLIALQLLIEQLGVIEEDLTLSRRELFGLVPGVYRRPLAGVDRYKMAQLERYATPDTPGVDPLPILAHMPLSKLVKEAWLSGQTVVEYAPRSDIAEACRRLAIRLDVAAGLAPASEWEQLPALESFLDVLHIGEADLIPANAGE